MSYTLVAIVGAMVVIVLGITLANLSYMQYYQRRREFGLLNAVGYTKHHILKKILAETSFIGIISSVSGFLISILSIILFNVVIWLPKGDEMPLWKPMQALFIMILPLVVCIESILPALKLLKRFDSISIIEGIN
ncbi:MAG: FtsX-like permease family protein [Bacillota bacterium]